MTGNYLVSRPRRTPWSFRPKSVYFHQVSIKVRDDGCLVVTKDAETIAAFMPGSWELVLRTEGRGADYDFFGEGKAA